MDSLGLTWETIHGKFEVTKETVEWIMQNASTSMFNKNRSYIYNKAFYEAFLNEAKQRRLQLFYEQLTRLRVKLNCNGKDIYEDR